MGKLAMAGVISGMGQGLDRGVLNMQSGIIQQGLMEQRQQWEAERLKQTFAHDVEMADLHEKRAGEREQRGYSHSEKLAEEGYRHAEANLGQQIGSNEAIHEQDRAANERIHKDDRESQAEQKEKDRTSTEQIHRDDRTSKSADDNRKMDIEEAHYKDMGEYYKALAKARAAGQPGDYKRLDIYKDFLVAQANAIRDQLKDPMTAPEDKERLNGQLEQMDGELRHILGIEAKKPAGSSGIVSPFPVPGAKPAQKTPATPGQAHAAPPPPTAGTLNQPPSQPAYVPGSEEWEDLKRALKPSSKRPAGPSMVPNQQ